MKRIFSLVLALPLALHAHTLPPQDKEALRAHILEEFMQKTGAKKVKPVEAPIPKTLKRPVTVAGLSGFDLSSFLTSGSALPPAGNGALMAASFAPFKPKVRYNWDGTTFFLESDNTPEGMPNKMFGITTWQQQVPIPAAYFAHSTSNENNAGSLGYQQPNVWRIPLVPTVSASPITIYDPPAAPTNFLRGAVALASNGIAIFNPANNTGQVSYEIGELDYYGGHCGLADDYHYHIIPTHLNTRFGGPLGDDKPVAWALDGYPIYGFVEPDGSPRQPLDAEGGHDHGPWGYHYHAVGTTTVDATHPYGTPQSPYMMKAFHGTVVNFGNQVDGQPAVANLRANGTGGYNAKAVAGAYIVAQMNPAPLVTDGSGHLNLVAGVNLTDCATTYGSTTVTCASTTGLTPGLAVVGYGVSNGARVTSVTNATQFVLSIPAIATTTGKNFTAVSMATASPDAHVMRVNMGGVDYDECWTINRKVNPRSLTMTWRAQALVGGQLSGPVLTTTQTYTPTAGSASGNRLTAYPMGAWSEVKLPDTSQAISTTTTFGEDSDYTTTPSANPQSFTDNGDGTITDNVTGLMWQKADAGEMTWENAVNNAGTVTTGGYSDWRLPNPHELMSLFNYETGNPAMNATYFPPASPSAEYWWSRDVFGTSTTNVWCVNSGGGVGPKPKAETVSAGGTLRYHARYVRLAQNNMTHNYVNNLDCTITDTDTSLMWTQIPSTAMTWEAALAWAEGLTLGGYNDWRMPNIKELQTLTDYSLATTSGGTATNLKPAINRTMFAKTMSGCSVTSGSPVVATSDTTDLAVGMTVIDPFSIAGTYINHTTTPTITAINPGVSFTLSSNALGTGTGLIFRALPLATAYWSSTSLKGNTTEAWLLELGVNTAVTPPRGAQGIISYQAKTASFPVFAVRSVSAGSVTQGLATTTTSNLFPPGQRVSAVGTITAKDNTTWTVPAATLYTSAEKAPDLYNEYNSVTPANLAAAQAAIAALPTKVIDADGEVVTGYIFADNYFELYVNGVLVGVDPVPFTAFNSCVVKFKAKRPITYAVRLVDWEENLGLGTELNGGNPHHIGDGGFIASFSDGTVTGSDWKAQTFYIAPLDDPNQVVELVNGTRSSAGATHTLTTTAYAMHYPLPDGWFSSGFSTAGWPAATTYSEAQVGVNSPAYMNFQPQFTGSGAQFIWSSSLTLDNEVVLRYTGPATTPTQIGVEQPAGTPLADGASTVAYGSVSIGSTLTKTFTIRNNGSTTLSITGVTVDGVNAANFSVTAAPASSIAAGATTTMDVRFDASSGGAKTAALHIACSDPAVDAAFDIELTGTGLVPPPTISNITINPISPSSTDNTIVTAQVTPGAGGAVSSVQLSFDTGGQTTSTVLNETMTSTETATGGWDGSGGAVPWTVQTSNGQGNIQQKLTANHTAAGQGGTCGVQLSKGDSAAANSITTTNAIDIGTATSAAIELWTSVSNINATGLGWSLQLATDASGTNWTTVLSELNVANHGFTKFHYDLTAGERVSTLRLRFNFFGNGTGGGTGPKVLLDDITLVATTGNPPTTITMYDDGLHGDGAAGDGVYGATIPAQADGETVNFTIAATGSGGAGTTTSSTTSYTVAPAPTITTSSPLPGGSTTGAYSQTFAATGGSGTGYVWSLFSGSLPNGLTLSSGGVLSGTPTQAGNFNFTIEVTDSANRSATKAFVLTITTVTAPNVLIILTDDQGWGDIGYHTPAGQIPIQTPRMDGFLNSGIRLENFYATTVCSVTRATLMTGRNQLRTGVNNTHGLALSEHIMPQTFKAAGYQTYMCGKWHIGGSDKNLGYTTVNGQNVRVIQEGLEYAPYNRGWDLHYGQYSGAIQYSTHNSNEALNPDLPDWWLNGVQQDGPSEHTDSQGHGGYSTDLLADKAVSCIQNRDPSKPMLLWLAFNAIHGPVSVPAEYLAKYSSITNTNRRTIAAAVDCMDAAIGRVLDQLTASGIADNTIVVFMSDNGGQESGGSLNDPLRGTKGDSWDGGVHMPAAISWPGVLATNVVSKQYVWVGDIFPTLCAATGVTAQNTEPFDGLNLWPALLSINSGNPDGQARPLDKPLVTISAAPIALNRFTDPVNGGEKVFKLIRNKVGQSVVNELYNMTDDVDPATGAPIESTDLLLGPNAAAYSAIVTSLTTAVTDITPINYPPYIGPPLITNTVSEGGNITLYAPFSSWPKTAPTVQWRKNGVNIPGGTFAQVMDIDSVVVAGGYAAKLDLTGVTAADAGSYDVVITNTGGITTSAAGTLTVTPASSSTTITNVATAPTAPTYLDPVWVLAQVQAAPGATISQVQLSYDLGVPVSTRVFQENFATTGTTTWNGTGAMNAWTTTAATANHVRQTTGTANHSIPVLLSNCSTTVGSSNVTCDSTSGLWPGMIITGVNVPTGATISSVASGTSFVISAAATGSSTALSLTAGGVTLTNCTTTAASTTVTCDSTAGLTPGMSLSGTGLANNASVSSITDATTFVMNTAPTTPGSGLTISVAGAGAEFQTGTASLTDAMFATTNAINASGASGYIEFYAQTRDLAAANNCGWTFQVSSDGGTTWNTRIAEDWNSSTVPLANCVLNAAGSVGGSTTVTCADTSALTTGRSVVGPTAYVTGGLTNGQPTVTTASTAALAVGMFVQGSTGIPNNTRILTIDSATQFTMSANATATDAAVAIAGTYFASNATVASITNGTTFVLNAPAYVNTSAAPIAASATTLNHGFQLYHYDLAGAELGPDLKMRWQFAGYSPTQPTRAPRVDVDDIIVATTSTPPPVALTMHDDGLHGDGAANDGWWGAAIPAQSGGTTVNFHVTATDSNGQSATSPVSSSYTYSVNASLTDATVKGAEFLGMPKDTSMTLNMVFAVDQEMFVEYGTSPGSYPFATTTALYSIDGAKPEFFNPAEITIQGLQPDTEYYYRVRHRAPGAPYFTARGERSFHTARPRGTTFTFTVTADPHIDVNTDMQLFWRAMQNISLDAPDIHLDIGDIFMTDKLADGLLGVPPRYKGGQPLSQVTLNERAIFFRNQFERACHSIPFFFTLGNHEAEYGYLFNNASDKQNNVPAWDLKSRKAFYPTPTPDTFYTGNPTPKDYTGGTLGLLEDYYAFEWGEALFIVLDPFWNVSTNPNQADDAWEWTLGKAQYDWLRDTLRNSSARYKFIFMHHIVGGSTQQANGTPQFAARGGIEVSDKFEWGGKNADGSPGFATKRPGWDMPIHDLLVLHRVNVVFHGHDHLYGYQTKDGIVYLECPQPGTPNYGSFGSAADGQYVNLGANSSSYLLPNSGHIRVTVGPDQAVADYVRSYRTATDPMPPDATSVFNDENASRHNRDISHSFVLAPKISPPIEVANVGPGQVGLRWNAVPNKPYEIQWTTDLKTWTTIDTLTFTNTHTNATYTDTLPARVNGQRAFYRVRYTP